MSDIDVEPAALDAYADNLDGNLQGRFVEISEYVTSAACDKSGFTGLFELLKPGVDLVDTLFQEMIEFGQGRMTSLAGGIRATAGRYRQSELANEDIFTSILAEIEEEEEQ